MVLTNPIDVDLMARRFSEAVRDNEAAEDLWLLVRPDVVELWLVTKPIDLDQELFFYRASQSLYRHFPASRVVFHLVNPAMFSPFVLEHIIPAGVERRPLR